MSARVTLSSDRFTSPQPPPYTLEDAESMEIFCMALRPYAGFGVCRGEVGAVEKYDNWIRTNKNLFYTNNTLTINNPYFTYLTPRIECLVNLRVVNLHNCRLKELPQEFAHLTGVEELRLGHNPLDLENVKTICQQLPCLKYVHLMETDTALIEMFEKEFPRVNLFIKTSH